MKAAYLPISLLSSPVFSFLYPLHSAILSRVLPSSPVRSSRFCSSLEIQLDGLAALLVPSGSRCSPAARRLSCTVGAGNTISVLKVGHAAGGCDRKLNATGYGRGDIVASLECVTVCVCLPGAQPRSQSWGPIP